MDPILKTFEELEIGDKFLTLDMVGNPVKYTVSSKDDCGLVEVEEIPLDISMDEFYVVETINS